jgi:hypothetical protein
MKQLFKSAFFSVTLLVYAIVANSRVAKASAPIPASFSGATLESFEGVRPGGNVQSPHGVYMWMAGPITFGSGVTLTGPFPQPILENGIVICDFSFAPGKAFSLGDNGYIGSASDVPNGSAFIALGSQDETRPLEFTIPIDVQRVGVMVTGPPPGSHPPGTITMTACDGAGTLLGSSSINARNVAFWGENFLAVEASGIRKVMIGGYVIVVDSLLFSAVPEPCTILLAAFAGSIIVAGRHWRPRC